MMRSLNNAALKREALCFLNNLYWWPLVCEHDGSVTVSHLSLDYVKLGSVLLAFPVQILGYASLSHVDFTRGWMLLDCNLPLTIITRSSSSSPPPAAAANWSKSGGHQSTTHNSTVATRQRVGMVILEVHKEAVTLRSVSYPRILTIRRKQWRGWSRCAARCL